MNHRALIVSGLIAGLLTGFEALAEEEPEVRASGGFEWKVTASEPRFVFEFSQRTRIGRDASKFAVEIQSGGHRHFYFGGGLGLVWVDDNARLNVRVEPVDFPGAVRTAKSDETAGSLNVFLGARFPLDKPFYAHVTVGYEDLNFKRDINNCTDCPAQKVSISAGGYYDVGFTFGRKWRFSVAQRTYSDSSDLESHIVLAVGRGR